MQNQATITAQVTAMQTKQQALQTQIAQLQAQAQALQDLAQNVTAGEFYIVKPSNAQINVGLQDLPKFVTLCLQALPLVQGSNALLPQQAQAITQLVLQACAMVESNGNVPVAKQRIAQA